MKLKLHDLDRVLNYHVDIQGVLVVLHLFLPRRVTVVSRIGAFVTIVTLVASLGTLFNKLIGVLEPPLYGTEEPGLDRPLLLVNGVARPGAFFLLVRITRPRPAGQDLVLLLGSEEEL